MKTYRVFYCPQGGKTVLVAMLPADSVKQALTRFNSAGFDGEIYCIQDIKFDPSLFNL